MKTTQKVILITGASAGMGKDFAKELLNDGHIVYGAARRTDKMEDIRQLGVKGFSA
jgi:NADP-dependent 3-hydroxy acid dehydrogenase YdfG